MVTAIKGLQWYWRHIAVTDLNLVPIIKFWSQNLDIGVIFWLVTPMLNDKGVVDDPNDQTATKVKTLSPTNFICNIGHQHRCGPIEFIGLIIWVEFLTRSSSLKWSSALWDRNRIFQRYVKSKSYIKMTDLAIISLWLDLYDESAKYSPYEIRWT